MEEVAGLAEKHLGSWKGQGVAAKSLDAAPETPKPSATALYLLDKPGAAQSVQAPGRDVSPVRLESAAPYYEDEFAQDQALPPIPSVETTPSSFRLGPWLVALFVILVVLAGVVVIVTFVAEGFGQLGDVVLRFRQIAGTQQLQDLPACASLLRIALNQV